MTDDRLRALVAAVLRVDAASIDEGASCDNVGTWDSLAQTEIAMELERNYGIELSEAQSERMTSMQEIIAVLAERGVRT